MIDFKTFADFTAQTVEIGSEGFDPEAISKLKAYIKKREPGSVLLALPEVEMLLALRILKRVKDSIRTTRAGLILLGKEVILRDVLPSAEVVYLHMTNETEYDKRIDCAQPLLILLDTIMNAISEYNRTFTIQIGLFTHEIPDFPINCVREALLNALVHRDYSLLSPVYVRHYKDRLDISSPGSLWGGITKDNILNHEPITRNPLLNSILCQLGLIEKAGVGIKKMITTLLALGKPPIHIETKNHFVHCIIRNGNLDETFARYILEQSKAGNEFGWSELLILSFLKRNREIEVKTASQLLQQSTDKAKALLDSLIERGILEPFGLTRGTVYRLSKAVFNELRKSVSYRLHRRAEARYAENLILEYIKENGYITNEICRTLLRINRYQAQYLLSQLVAKGKLTQPAKGRNARYFRRHY